MVKSILVIDDEPGVRDAFELALRDEGYEVRMAESGEAGLKAAGEKAPDLVFLDLNMPGIDGVETLRRLREIAPSSRVYIVTAFVKEYLKPLQAAADDGLEFEVASKPLCSEHIRQITRGTVD